MNLTFEDGYDTGYQDGFDKGYRIGYEEMYRDIEESFQERVAKLYAEILELNARVAVLDRKLS